MNRRVLAEGPVKCRIAIVGEYPTASEAIEGRPFVGRAGNLLNSKLSLLGVGRHECYLTLLRKTEKKEALWVGTRPNVLMMELRTQLLHELDMLETNIVVAMGPNVLWALTGENKIGKWRGTVGTCTLPSGRVMKVMGTYNPQAALKKGEHGTIMHADLAKALKEGATRELKVPERTYLLKPNRHEVEAFLASPMSKDLSFDIETSPRGIECISFAWSPKIAMSVPTTIEYWGTVEELKYIVEVIDRVMQRTDITKVAQNITYDVQYMARVWGILPAKPWFDTMIAQHSCYSELPKGLGFLTSLYTDEPYYKDDLKVWMAGGSSSEALWRYNAVDSAVTEEIKLRLEQEMDELGTRKTYDFMMDLLEPLLFCMLRGLKVDQDAIDKHEVETTAKLEKMEEAFGITFPGVNPHSNVQVKKLAYETLNLKPVLKKGVPSVAKDALAKLADRSPELAEVSTIRAERSLRSTYVRVPLDRVDGRLRFSLNSTGTETGRLSSSESVFYCGNNLQNWPKRVRNIIVPEEDYMVFTEADLKGAEAQIVAYLAEDLPLIKLFEEGGNIHHFTALNILWPDMTLEELKADKEKCHAEGRDNESKYSLAKKVRHGGNYNMGWVTLKNNLKCTAIEAKKYLASFHAHSPAIRMWHTEVEEKLRESRMLEAPLGRKRFFMGLWGDSLLKEAIAFVPQETCASVLNYGLINVYNNLCGHPQINLKTQTHDSILIEHPKSLTSMIHGRLHELMDIPVTVKGRTFSIPIELEMGPNWRDLKEVA